MEAPDTWAMPLQTEIERLLYTLFFAPLMQEIEETKDNAIEKKGALITAIDSEKLVYKDGFFEGEQNSLTSRVLKNMGAIFNKQKKAWAIPVEKLPVDIRNALGKAIQRAANRERKLQSALTHIQDVVKQIMPKFSFQGVSRETLLKMKDKVRRTIPNEMAVQPKIDKDAQKKLNDDYTSNVQLSIVGFLDDEVLKFRDKVLPNIKAGMSRIELQRYIDSRLKVGKERAKFIARQETGLFTSKLKEVQYKSAGIEKYRWKAIGGSRGDGRTRDSHMQAHGHIFYFDRDKNDEGIFKPTQEGTGKFVNPSQSWSCRCQAVPIVDEI